MTSFPSLTIRRDALVPHGAFAEAQAQYLRPDPTAVAALDELLAEKRVGVVAHFYMDAELQGVLAACAWPHVHVSDSLLMAERAVAMAEAGVAAIVVLGVDFMSESVRSQLDAAGFAHVPVYRLAKEAIGCSLAAAADTARYAAFLRRAAAAPAPLHVIYINTSLRVKGMAQALVPTITCTSSNVVRVILQAFAQVPELGLWYGPDTYMGENLASLLDWFAGLPDAEVRALHPDHTPATIARARAAFHHFTEGTCVVHHMFGRDVVERVRREHADALCTAHLEVPGEMFALAGEAQRIGRGVVGSTSQILEFIGRKVDEAAARPGPARLPVVLGTESGMVTSIVHRVQGALRRLARPDVEVEVIFPVAGEAIAAAPGSPLAIVPGAASGEGCSAAGGCATCPYMKMNDLSRLFDVVGAVGGPAEAIEGFAPRRADSAEAHALARAASSTIEEMRHFQRTGRLSDALVARIRAA